MNETKMHSFEICTEAGMIVVELEAKKYFAWVGQYENGLRGTYESYREGDFWKYHLENFHKAVYREMNRKYKYLVA